MKSLVTILSAVLFALVSVGCESQKATPKENSESKKIPNKVIVMGVDETGSYGLWEQAKAIAVKIIEKLEPGDIFYLRRITETSYLDSCTIFRLELPFFRRIDNDNPFDRKAKIRRRSQIARINALKKEASNRVAAIKFTNAKKTDIYGFLAAASDRFSLSPKHYKRIVIMASDLQDNVGYKVNLELSGALVVVLGFQSSKDPGQTQELKNRWTKRLAEAGAVKVVFLAVEESVTMDLFRSA